MEKLIGNKICVVLKEGNRETPSGLLIDVDESYIYIQMENSNRLYVIPKININYYISESFSSPSKIINPTPNSLPRQIHQDDLDSVISVFINGDFITDIPVPHSFDLSKYNDDIMAAVLNNIIVQRILAGRKQKQLYYEIGRVYITTVPEEEENTADISTDKNIPTTFSMGAAVNNQFLSGEEMVQRLNNMVSGDNK